MVSLRARNWNEAKHPRDDRGRFARKGGARWASKVLKGFEARFGDTSMAQGQDPRERGRLQTGAGGLLDIAGMGKAARERFPKAPTVAKGTFERGPSSASSSNAGVTGPTTKRAFAIKIGDRFMHNGAEVEAVGMPRAGRKAGQAVTVVKVRRIADDKIGPITIPGESVRMAGPSERQDFVEVPLGRSPGDQAGPKAVRGVEGISDAEAFDGMTVERGRGGQWNVRDTDGTTLSEHRSKREALQARAEKVPLRQRVREGGPTMPGADELARQVSHQESVVAVARGRLHMAEQNRKASRGDQKRIVSQEERDAARTVAEAEAKAELLRERAGLGRTPGGVDMSRVPVKAGGVTTSEARRQAVIDMGTSFSGNPHMKLPKLEALTDDDFAALTPDQQDNVRFLIHKLTQRAPGEGQRRAVALQERFGKWGQSAKAEAIQSFQDAAKTARAAGLPEGSHLMPGGGAGDRPRNIEQGAGADFLAETKAALADSDPRRDGSWNLSEKPPPGAKIPLTRNGTIKAPGSRPAQMIRAAQEEMRQRLNALEGPKDKLARVKVMRQVLAEDVDMDPKAQEHFRQQLAGTLLRELRKPAGADPRLAREVLPEITKAQFDAMPEVDQKAITEEIAAIIRAGATREIRNVGHRLRGEPEEPAPPPSVGTMSPILALNIGRAPDSKLARNVRDQIARAERRTGRSGRTPGGSPTTTPETPTTLPQTESTPAYDKLLSTDGPAAMQNKTMRGVVEQMEAHGWQLKGQNPMMQMTTWEAPDGRTLAVMGINTKKPTIWSSEHPNASGTRELNFKATMAHVITPTFRQAPAPSISAAMEKLGMPSLSGKSWSDPGLASRDRSYKPLEDVQRAMMSRSLGYSGAQDMSPAEAAAKLRATATQNRATAEQRIAYDSGISGGGRYVTSQAQLLLDRADQFDQVADELERMDAAHKASVAERERLAALPPDIRPGRSVLAPKPAGRAPGGRAPRQDPGEVADKLRAINTRQEANEALKDLTLAELKAVHDAWLASQPETPFNRGKLAAKTKAEAVEKLVELTVGARINSEAIRRGVQRGAEGRAPGGKA